MSEERVSTCLLRVGGREAKPIVVSQMSEMRVRWEISVSWVAWHVVFLPSCKENRISQLEELEHLSLGENQAVGTAFSAVSLERNIKLHVLCYYNYIYIIVVL